MKLSTSEHSVTVTQSIHPEETSSILHFIVFISTDAVSNYTPSSYVVIGSLADT